MHVTTHLALCTIIYLWTVSSFALYLYLIKILRKLRQLADHRQLPVTVRIRFKPLARAITRNNHWKGGSTTLQDFQDG